MNLRSDICCYCGTCANVCPTNAIELHDGGRVILDHEKCTECKICLKVCPVEAIEE